MQLEIYNYSYIQCILNHPSVHFCSKEAAHSAHRVHADHWAPIYINPIFQHLTCSLCQGNSSACPDTFKCFLL